MKAEHGTPRDPKVERMSRKMVGTLLRFGAGGTMAYDELIDMRNGLEILKSAACRELRQLDELRAKSATTLGERIVSDMFEAQARAQSAA